MNKGDPKVVQFKEQCKEDTGFLCRNLLGWNYDKDEKTGDHVNIGSGGVRGNGPHRQMTDFLDAKGKKFKLLLAPRGSYKSTILQGYCVRRILRDPNVRILYGMLNDRIAEDKSAAVRACLTNPNLEALFGKQIEGPSDVNGWTVCSRTRHNLQEPTFRTFTTNAPATGGHFEVVIVDDPIDEEWCSEDMMARAKRAIRQVFPLVEQGGVFILVGTRYSEDDVFGEALSEGRWARLTMDSGDDISVEQAANGSYRVTGTPRFAHQSLEYLNDALAIMKPRAFMSQYMNRIQNDVRDMFTRDLFQTCRWDTDMSGLSGYLLTDTASSTNEDACYSVLAYVGLDSQYNTYLLDLKVGRWHTEEFGQHYFDMLHAWMQKVNHVGETMESNQATQTMMGHLNYVARLKGYKLNVIKIQRSGGDGGKQRRIMAIQPLFKQRRFFVVDTVPRTFTDVDGEKVLWDPEGIKDDVSHIPQPDGELVRQFIRFPLYPRNDIADAIADIEAVDKKNNYARYCTYRAPKPKAQWSIPEQRRQKLIQYEQGFPSGGSSNDFWTEIARANNIQA